MLGGIRLIEAFEHGPEYCQRRGEVVNGPGARIELVGDGIQLLLGVHGQVRPLGQILAQQAVGVLA